MIIYVHLNPAKLLRSLLKNFYHFAIASGYEIIQPVLDLPLIKWNLEWLTCDFWLKAS